MRHVSQKRWEAIVAGERATCEAWDRYLEAYDKLRRALGIGENDVQKLNWLNGITDNEPQLLKLMEWLKLAAPRKRTALRRRASKAEGR